MLGHVRFDGSGMNMNIIGTRLQSWIQVVHVMVSFTSSVTSVVNKRSLLPTQLNDGNLKDKTYYPADFSSLVTLSLSP